MMRTTGEKQTPLVHAKSYRMTSGSSWSTMLSCWFGLRLGQHMKNGERERSCAKKKKGTMLQGEIANLTVRG